MKIIINVPNEYFELISRDHKQSLAVLKSHVKYSVRELIRSEISLKEMKTLQKATQGQLNKFKNNIIVKIEKD